MINASGTIDDLPTTTIVASGSIRYSMSENEIREGFQEAFGGFSESMEAFLNTPLYPEEKVIARVMGQSRMPTAAYKPEPPPKAEPPLSQRPKPIINRKGRVKRAFDFDD